MYGIGCPGVFGLTIFHQANALAKYELCFIFVCLGIALTLLQLDRQKP